MDLGARHRDVLPAGGENVTKKRECPKCGLQASTTKRSGFACRWHDAADCEVSTSTLMSGGGVPRAAEVRMTNVTKLLALADRCEKAGGPDRELADDILRATGWRYDTPAHNPSHMKRWIRPDGNYVAYGPQPDPTGNTDDAMTLLPSNTSCAVTMRFNCGKRRKVDLMVLDRNQPSYIRAASTALALCSAALRAVAEEMT